MDKFINKLDFDFSSNQQILNLITAIDSFKGKWNLTENQENKYLKELRRIATIESIGSSTRIEGATMTDNEIQELLKDIRITKFKNRDEQEVVGYYNVLELIYENYDNIHLSGSYIQQLHQLLLKHSNKDKRHRGGYKHMSNKVVSNYPTGEQKIIFATTEPALVEGEMQELIAWTNLQLNLQSIHPLIVTASFIYDFLSIHPFQDGNGRLSRLLTTLCLLKNDYSFIKYISFENHIEQNKRDYYRALMDGQKNRNSNAERIDKWLLFFLDSISILTHKLEDKYDVFKSKGGYLNERQKAIKQYIEKNQAVKVSDISTYFADIQLSTIKKDLKYLRQEQEIQMIGKGKGSVYLKKR
ncbi:MAG: Fic family protein [Bacteroidales bacterium]